MTKTKMFVLFFEAERLTHQIEIEILNLVLAVARDPAGITDAVERHKRLLALLETANARRDRRARMLQDSDVLL